MATELIPTRALTNLERMKKRLTITGTDFDVLLERLIMAITDELESRCNRKFGRAIYTNEVYSNYNHGAKMLSLNQTPVISIASLSYRAGTPSTPAWTAFGTDDYELSGDGKSGLVRIYGNVPGGTNVLRATYTAGYLINFDDPTDTAEHTLPFDLTDLAERLIVKRFKRREAEGKGTETFEGGTVVWEELINAADREIIARYTRLPVFV